MSRERLGPPVPTKAAKLLRRDRLAAGISQNAIGREMGWTTSAMLGQLEAGSRTLTPDMNNRVREAMARIVARREASVE